MSKYFKDEDEIQLSEYAKESISPEMKKAAKYLMFCLGDVSLSKDIIEAYEDFFSHYSSKYDVKFEGDTIKGLYDFYKKFPRLSHKAFYEISFRYIKDLFEEYSLDAVFEKLIKLYGEVDDAMEMFISYIERKADELQEKYKDDASKLDEYSQIYYMEEFSEFYQYISYLKSLVLTQHISVDSILASLAAPELIKQDAKQLSELSRRYRCYMGAGYPVSYLMTKSFAKKEDLSKYGDRPLYYISSSDKLEEATFTTQEFIDSIKQEKAKKLISKK